MGSVVISLDAELAWGFHDRDRLPVERLREARRSWRWLVEVFDRYDVPATWAIVGHLLLDECDGEHADHPAPAGWFARDPGRGVGRTGAKRDAGWPDWWYGDGLVEAVADAGADHEIACHTFSHAVFDERKTTREFAAAELARCVELADERGFDLETLVFPRNVVGHLDVAADLGFSAYRGVAPNRWYEAHGGRVAPAGKALTYALDSSSPPIVSPTIDEHDLVNVPASMLLFSLGYPARGLVDRVAGDPVVRQARAGIDAATREEGVFHLWFHPNNLTGGRDRRRVERVLSHVAERRADGLEVETMADAAARARRVPA